MDKQSSLTNECDEDAVEIHLYHADVASHSVKEPMLNGPSGRRRKKGNRTKQQNRNKWRRAK